MARWLTDAGWRVVERRARSSTGGEVDIVAVDPHDTLVAIEVRARRSVRAGAAATTVDARKVARLRRTLATIGSGGAHAHHGLRVDLVTAEPVNERTAWHLVRVPGI